MASGWNLWVCVESMGVASGCGCKEVSGADPGLTVGGG